MLGGQPNHIWQHCFLLLLHAGGSDLRLYDVSNSKTSIDERVGAWSCVWGRTHGVWLLDFFLRYSEVCSTCIESLFLFCLFFVCRFECTRRWYVGWFGSFVRSRHLLYLSNTEIRVRMLPSSICNPSMFYWPFIGGASFVDHFCFMCISHTVLSVPCNLLDTCGERAYLFALWYVMFLSLSHIMFWVRCGVCLYRFLIYAFFLTFT